MSSSHHPRRTLLLCFLLISSVLAVYSNHFRNDFHFDDLSAIVQNPAIRDVSTVFRAFTDVRLFSSAPGQQIYRPIVTASLAIDYWCGGGLNTPAFHISTFLWYSVLLILMFLLLERIFQQTDPHPSNTWVALTAALIFGFHPANAETVNYIIQRADLYNALGCVAALWLFIRFPAQRKFGWYLLPAVAGILAKAPGVVFPALLLSYVLLFEERRSWRSIAAAAAATGGAAILLQTMQPHTWAPGGTSPFLYRITQPYMALTYFASYFAPIRLAVDHGWQYLEPLSAAAIAGYLFIGLLLMTIAITARSTKGKPIAFGLSWFVITILPTSLTPLGDVMNDHRMFFPFVGLTIAVAWALRIALFRKTARLTANHQWVQGALVALSILLAVAGMATRVRNRVWSTEQSLWRDAIQKNPWNRRAWTNYGADAYAQADYPAALAYWQKAAALDPDCALCETNLVRVAMQLHQPDLQEQHLRRLVAMNPPTPEPYIDYAEFLGSQGRFDDGRRLLDRAAQRYRHSDLVTKAVRKLLLERDAADRIRLLQVLDVDHDTDLSASEILAAPDVLRALDLDSDGKLSAEECGANLGDESTLSPAAIEKARREFMRSNPLLRALDTDGDGEISLQEIENAGKELQALDADEDGVLTASELVPPDVAELVRRMMTVLDLNHDGVIGPNEIAAKSAEAYRGLLNSADVNQDGAVTLEELTNEIFYRADTDKDGLVTPQEIAEAVRSGRLGPVPQWTATARRRR